MNPTSKKYDVAEISLEICRRLGINTQGRTSGNIMVPCFSHHEKEGSLSISLDKGIYHCFGCGVSGTLAGKYFETFQRSIYKDLDAQVDSLLFEKRPNFDDLPETDFFLDGDTYKATSTDKGRDFISLRGLTEKVLNEARAEFCHKGIIKRKSNLTNKEEWVYIKDRVVFPIYEKQRILSLEMRDIYGEEVYLKSFRNPEKAPKYKKVLYPKHSSVNTLYDLDSLDVNKPLYITEGLMDVLSLRTHNHFKNSTCLFRNLPSERQLYLYNK